MLDNFTKTGGDDSPSLIEFTPLWKTEVSGYHFQLKIENISGKQVLTIHHL